MSTSTPAIAERVEKRTGKRHPRPRTRVLFIAITFHPEPGALRGLPLARRLVESGDFDVTVLTAVPWYPLGRTYPGYRQRWRQWESIDGVRVLRVPIYPSHDSSALRRIGTYLSFMFFALFVGLPLAGPTDVIYHVDNLPSTGLVALLYGVFRRAPVVQHIGDLWPESVTESGMLPRNLAGRIIGRVLRRICDFVYRRDDRLTVLSPGFKRILADRGVEESKIDVVYNWAEEDRFFPVPRDENLARTLGFTGKFNIVYAGNIGPMQALETVVRAAELVQDLAHVQILVIGGGSRAAAVEALSRGLGLANVRFLGRLPIEEMNEINALADVLLVHLADIEFLSATIPSKVQVALASGRPVLLGVRGDGATLVTAAGAGICFVPGDSASLARAIRTISVLPQSQLKRMGDRGRDYYIRNLSLEVGYRHMAQVFTDLRHV